MAEIAGLVLSGLPLAILVLDKYAEPFTAFRHYHSSIQTFRANLFLQNRYLQMTLSSIGLRSDPSIVELRECFETEYPSVSRELLCIVQRMDEITAGLMEKLDITANGKPDAMPDRVHWEWRRVKNSLRAKQRDKVIEDLRHWNEDLRRVLEKPEVPAEDDSREVQCLNRRFNVQRCDSIRRCLNSLHRALDSGLRCTCSPSHQVAINLDWMAYESDTTKTFKVAVSYGTGTQPSHGLGSWRKLRITSETAAKMVESVPDLPSPPFPPTRAPSQTSQLRIRFLSRKPRPSTIAPDTSMEAISSTSYRALAATSPSPSTTITSLCDKVCTDLNPWTLTGFLEDPEENQDRRFCLNHHQTDSSEIIESVPLKSLLSFQKQSNQHRNPYSSLSAKQRYGIAASIAWAVLHLSGSLWFGDHWDQKQVGIFRERTQNGQEVLSRHSSASYNFSSPETSDEPFTNEFQDLIPNRTLFALGILLIELCINKPFAEIRRSSEGTMPPSLLDDYRTAVNSLDEVYRLAGDSYGYATERCVKFTFQGRDRYKGFEFSPFRQQFHDAVVAPVQATYRMFADL